MYSRVLKIVVNCCNVEQITWLLAGRAIFYLFIDSFLWLSEDGDAVMKRQVWEEMLQYMTIYDAQGGNVYKQKQAPKYWQVLRKRN